MTTTMDDDVIANYRHRDAEGNVVMGVTPPSNLVWNNNDNDIANDDGYQEHCDEKITSDDNDSSRRRRRRKQS